jgi:hypothetical protein
MLNLPTLGFATPSIAARNIKKTRKNGIMPTATKKSNSVVSESPLFMSSTARSARINDATSFAKLRKISNFASFLCVLDCTLLPIITVALPLLGILNLGAAQLEWLHHLGHSLAIFFVLPVGGMTTVVNYLSHRKRWITSLASLGLVLVGLANSHFQHLPFFGHVEFLHTIQHGSLHRVVNILGCAFLLGSNVLSSKQPECACCPSPGESADMTMNSMTRSMQYRQYMTKVRKTNDK